MRERTTHESTHDVRMESLEVWQMDSTDRMNLADVWASWEGDRC